MIRKILLGAAAALSIGLAGCTSAEEQAAIGAVQLACEAGPVVVSIATANVGIASLSTAAGQGCTTIIAQVQNYIAQATANGQAAVVTVSQAASPTTKAMRRKFSVRRGAGGMVVTDEATKQVFVVPPGPFSGF